MRRRGQGAARGDRDVTGPLIVLAAGVLAIAVAPGSALMVVTGAALVAFAVACLTYGRRRRGGGRG